MAELTWSTTVRSFELLGTPAYGTGVNSPAIPSSWLSVSTPRVVTGIGALEDGNFYIGIAAGSSQAETVREDLLSAVESGIVITLSSGEDVLTLNGITDPSEPYLWTPSNSSEVIAWYEARSIGDPLTVRLEYPPPLPISPIAIEGDLAGNLVGVLSLGTYPPLGIAPIPIEGNLQGEPVGSLALGQVPLPPLVLTDFDQTDLQIDFLALIEAGLDITGDNRTYYADANRPPITGALLDGELGVSLTETLLTRFQYIFQGSNAGQIRLNDDDVPATFSWQTYFAGAGSDLTLYVQTADSLVAIPVADNIVSSGGGFVRLSVPTAAGRAVLNSIAENDRFILAAARPPPPISITPVIIEGDLAGEVVAGVSLGQAPVLISPLTIDGGLSGDITGILSLGQAPSPPAIEIQPVPIDGGLLGDVVAGVSLGDAPVIIPPPATFVTLNLPVSSSTPTFHLIGPSAILPAGLMVGERDDVTIGDNSFIQHTGIQINLNPNVDFKPIVEVDLLMRFSYNGVERLVVRGTGSDTAEPYFLNHDPESGSYRDLFEAISGTDTPIILELEYGTLIDPVEIFPIAIEGNLSGELVGSLALQSYVDFHGQSLSFGLALSRATLSPQDITRVDFQGQPLSFGLSLSQATLFTQRLINLLGRASPIRNNAGALVRPEAIFAPISALKLTGAFPAFCPSKRVLLGSKVYPFAGLDYIGNSELVSASWRQKLNNSSFSVAQNVSLGNFTDILAAIRFTPQTLDEYGTYLYEISLINKSNGTATININILCNVIAGTDKSVQRNITFKPFADFMIAKNSQAIKNIEYEISGDTTLSRRSVGRSTIFLGQHEAIHNAGYVYDGKRDFNRVDINLGSDILYNVNDMCSGIIMSIGNDGNALIPDMLSGGTLNEFNPGDYYQVQDGDNVDKRARKLELSIDELSTSLIQLFATDQQDGVSVGNVLVRCD